MNKRIKRIIFGAALFAIAIILPEEPNLLKLGVFVAAYGVVGYKVIWKAVRGIINGKVVYFASQKMHL